MKKIDIIKGLCTMGSTECVGVFETPSDGIVDYVKQMFGDDAQGIKGEVELKPNTEYLYSYGNLINDIEDELIFADDCEIYVYEIED